MGGSYPDKTLFAGVVVVVERLLAGDMLQQHIAQQPIAGLLKRSTVRGHRMHQPGMKNIEDVRRKGLGQLLEEQLVNHAAQIGAQGKLTGHGLLEQPGVG